MIGLYILRQQDCVLATDLSKGVCAFTTSFWAYYFLQGIVLRNIMRGGRSKIPRSPRQGLYGCHQMYTCVYTCALNLHNSMSLRISRRHREENTVSPFEN